MSEADHQYALADEQEAALRLGLERNGAATAQRSAETARTESEEDRKEACERAKALSRDPNILDSFIWDLRRTGLVGEARAAKLLFLVLTSRVLPHPVSAAIKGQSSGGKSYLVDSVLKFFPNSAIVRRTAMSEKTLAYGTEDLKHKMIVVAEASGLSSGVGAYLMRSLISEGFLTYETIDSAEGLKPKILDRSGPAGLVVTTTKFRLDGELETRLFSIPIDESPEQTHAVMRAKASKQGTEIVDLCHWHIFQDDLSKAENEVEIPYAKALADKVPPLGTRMRRDFDALLRLIETHAILHQASRPRDANGRIIATLEDYTAVRVLVDDLIAQGLQVSVPPDVRETVQAMRECSKNPNRPVKLAQLADVLGLHKTTVWRRTEKAVQLGYLEKWDEKKGKPAEYVIGEPMPNDTGILPPPETLNDAA